jgi:murein biosynthesis integral membrane protein MurJ
MIYLLGQRLWPGKIGRLGGLMAGILFLGFPSALQWYGQNHKDAFAIAGILSMLYAWLTALDSSAEKQWRQLILLMLSGAALLAVVRPYYPTLVLCSFGFSWVFCFFISTIRGRLKEDLRGLGAAIVLVMLLLPIALLSAPISKKTGGAYGVQMSEGLIKEVNEAIVIKKKLLRLSAIKNVGVKNQLLLEDKELAEDIKKPWWVKSELLPDVLDRQLERISTIRAHFIIFSQQVGAGSSIDADNMPDNAVSMLCYLPRAMFVGFFVPFPTHWTEKVSAVRLVGAIETLIWYVVTSGVFVLLYRRPSRPLIAGLLFVSILIMVLSYAHPNIGSLYRQRFGLWFFALLCGAVGWSNLIYRFLYPATADTLSDAHRQTTVANDVLPKGKKEALAASGAVVLIVTLCCYLGFIARDLMLARLNGMSSRMDVFFSASMIPMFFVTFVALPLSDTFTAPFLRTAGTPGKQGTAPLERVFMLYAVVILGGISILTLLLADRLIPLVLKTTSGDALSLGTNILRLYAPIIFFSAWTVIGNSILNARHYSRQAAQAQLIVPIVTIGAIIASPAQHGLYAAALGMTVGTFLNAVAVVWLVRNLGLSLWPTRNVQMPFLKKVLNPYWWLSAAAFFTAANTPVSYFFASTIENGMVAVWALASKIVTLFTGLASVGIAAIVLPHLAHWVERENVPERKNDVLFLLLMGTWIGIGLALVVFVFSEPLVFVLFNGGRVQDEQLRALAAVVKVGCLQLPMVVASAVIVKVTAVTGRSVKTVVAALGMITINIACNLALVPYFGILGIALSSVISMGVSTAFLMTMERRACLLKKTEVLLLIISWTVLGGVSVATHFGSWETAITSGICIPCLALAHLWMWRSRMPTELA